MEPAEIKKRLAERHIKQSDIARLAGRKSRAAVHRVIHSQSVSRRIRRLIGHAILTPVDTIWPPRRKPARC